MVEVENAAFVERRRRRTFIVGLLVASDTVALLAATLLAAYVRFDSSFISGGMPQISPGISYYEICIAVTLLWLAALAGGHLYDLDRLFWGGGELSRVVRALAVGVVAFIMLTYAFKTPGLSRAWTLLAFAFACAFVMLGRLCVRGYLRYLRRGRKLLRRTLVVGSNAEAAELMRALESHAEQGMLPVACLTSAVGDDAREVAGVPVLGSARAVGAVVPREHIDTVIIVSSAFDQAVVARIANELRGLDVSIHVSSGLSDILSSRVLVREVAGVPVVTVRPVSLSAGNLAVKRVFDMTLATLGIVVGMPVWLLLALAIKLDSRGPVFYRQLRVGQHGKLFEMYKFRSMAADADARRTELAARNEATGPLFKMRDDPRVTRVGRWMRALSIDEFPQLINVMNGTMSLVGPRPPLPGETESYSPQHWRRMEVPPGMTGLWQVSGRSTLSFEDMVRLDVFYIENWSVGFDLSLLMRTVPAVLLARGAY